MSLIQASNFNFASSQFNVDNFKEAGLSESALVQQKKRPNPTRKKSKQIWSVIIHSKAAHYTNQAIEISRKIVEVAQRFFSASYEIFAANLQQSSKLQTVTKVFDVALIPFITINLLKSIKEIIHGDRKARIDSLISFADELGALGSCLTTFTLGLAKVGMVSVRIFEWAGPLYFVSSVLSFASFMKNVRTYSAMKSLKQEFNNVGHLSKYVKESSLEDFHAVLNLIKKKESQDKEFVKKVFNCSDIALSKELIAIEKKASMQLASSDPEDKIAAGLLLNKTLKSLTGKIHSVGTHSALAATVSVISLLGAIALFSSPSAPIAYGIVAVGASMSVGNLIYHKLSEHKFTKNLGMTKKFHEWIC